MLGPLRNLQKRRRSQLSNKLLIRIVSSSSLIPGKSECDFCLSNLKEIDTNFLYTMQKYLTRQTGLRIFLTIWLFSAKCIPVAEIHYLTIIQCWTWLLVKTYKLLFYEVGWYHIYIFYVQFLWIRFIFTMSRSDNPLTKW